jgi:hypothetical protein
VHEAVTLFTMYSYNFCWAVRTLRRVLPAQALHELRQLQLLLGGADVAAARRQRAVAAADPSDDGGVSGPRLEQGRVAHTPGRSTLVGHHPGVSYYRITSLAFRTASSKHHAKVVNGGGAVRSRHGARYN